MIHLIKTLCELNGTSGNEQAVAAHIGNLLNEKNMDFQTDALGNLYVHKPGRGSDKSPLMVCAHMDEVALIITHICSDGSLCFDTVGGIDEKILPGKSVIIGGKFGVLGIKPVHLISSDQKGKALKISDMRIDIGAADEAEAMQFAAPGDIAYFTTVSCDLGEDLLLCKAADDRAGCAMLLKLLEREFDRDLDIVFTTQEEVGCRGAAAAAFNLAPKQCVVLECTTAADNAGLPDEKCVCSVGDGPVVGYMDRGTVYDRDMVNCALTTAEEKNIPVQIKKGIFGGNDSGSIHKSRGGVKTLAVSVPCRNLHGPSLVLSKTDIENSFRLLCELVDKL